MNPDKRCEHRVSISTPLLLTHQNQTFTGKMLNISLCGMGILSEHALNETEKVSLELTLPGYSQTQNLKLNAEVVHCTLVHDTYFIGLVFTGLDMHQQLVIKEFSHFHQRFEA